MVKRRRDYQDKTIQSIISNYENGIQRNLAVLATGLGKTFVTTEFHKDFYPNEKLLFLVDRKELAYQARDAFLESNPKLKVGVEMNIHKASLKDDVIIASVHSIGRKGSKRITKFNVSDFNKIVVDEAHMSVSDIFVRSLNYLGVGPDNLEKNKILIGLTATPNRSDGIPLGRIYDSIAAKYDLAWGIRNGWLTDLDVLQIQTDVEIPDWVHTKSDFDIEKLTQIINTENRNALILKSYLDTSYDKSAIVYCASVDHAYTLTEIFQEHNITSACIEANTNTSERKAAIKEYKKGKIKVLFNYGTLTTGFDAPETSTIILGRPIKSDLLLRQIIGRGVRPSQYAFVDYAPDLKHRLLQIEKSVKSACQVIDIHDIVDSGKICSIPSLFGFADDLEIPNEQKKFFKQIVEPIEEVVRERGLDVKDIKNIEDLHLLIKRKPVNVKSYHPTEDVKQHSIRNWLPTSKNQYELLFAKEKQSLIVEQNTLDKYEVYVVDNKNGLGKKLQEFSDLSGAIKLADDYASRHFDTTYVDSKPEWYDNGVSKSQANFLLKLYKGGIRVDKFNKYEDTGAPVLYFRKTGEKVTAGLADTLIQQRIGKK